MDVVRFLLDRGEDPDRYNPEGAHAHATPLHHAACGGHAGVVELLVERGARLDLKDRIYAGTPFGWARHGGHSEIDAYLRSRGASRARSARSQRIQAVGREHRAAWPRQRGGPLLGGARCRRDV